MSRCFPFPPPGYEKKLRIDDPGYLAKEKHKEKKHKKKDKEKKEGKEKKDKDRSKDKHKEKKDHKEKHKERDQERDTEKNQSSDAKGSELQTGFCNGEKLDPYGMDNSEIKDSKHMQELARRIRDQDGALGSQMVLNVSATDVRRAKMLGMASESNDVRKLEEFNVKDQKEDHHRKENGQGNRVFASVMENLSVQMSSSMEREQVGPIAKPPGKEETDKRMERKEKKRHKEKHKDRDRGKDKDSKDKDRDKVKKMEEISKENRDSSKEPPKWNESIQKLEQSTSEPIDFRNINPSHPSKLGSASGDGNPNKRKEHENGYILNDGNRPNKFAKLSFQQPVIANGRKLEPSQTMIQFGQNGASLKNHGVEIKESKINGFIAQQRPYESSEMLPSTGVTRKENSEASAKAETPHPNTKCPTDVTRNGNGEASAEVKLSHPDARYPTHVTRNENSEASARVKPPHPDAKYLSQILAVPTMEDLHGSLDEEWLFGVDHLPSKKLNTGLYPVDCTQQVWSEAVHIESADVSALPYVLPY